MSRVTATERTRSARLTPAELYDRIREFGPEAAYVASHVVRLDENVYQRFKILYHYLARDTEFRVDGDTGTVLIGGVRRQWSALDEIDTVHGRDDTPAEGE